MVMENMRLVMQWGRDDFIVYYWYWVYTDHSSFLFFGRVFQVGWIVGLHDYWDIADKMIEG